MTNLKPCPFCGGEAKVPAIPIGITDDDVPVECSNIDCNASEMTFDKGNWNSRPTEDVLNARIAELEAMTIDEFALMKHQKQYGGDQ